MDPFTAISMGISVVGGVAKMVDGFTRKKAAQQKMRELEAAPLPLNAFEALQVPTEGTQIQREELQRQAASAASQMQQAGTRAIVGGIGDFQEAQTKGYRQIGADIDEAMFKRDTMAAQEQSNINMVGEERLAAQISGTAADIGAARQDIMGGMGDVANTALSFGLARQEQSAYSNPEGNATATRKENRASMRDSRRTIRQSKKVSNRAKRSGGANYSIFN